MAVTSKQEDDSDLKRQSVARGRQGRLQEKEFFLQHAEARGEVHGDQVVEVVEVRQRGANDEDPFTFVAIDMK